MTLRHMKIFEAVYRHSNITRAAGELHLAQPSVSLAVRELEDYYGIRLFERIGRHISPTDAGTEFYGYARHIVSLFDDMEKSVRNRDAFGTLRVGTSITIGTCILPRLIRLCTEARPGLKIEAVVDTSSDIERHILDNTVDLGLIETSPESPDIVYEAFQKDSLSLSHAGEGQRGKGASGRKLFPASAHRPSRLGERQHPGHRQRRFRRAWRRCPAGIPGGKGHPGGKRKKAPSESSDPQGAEHHLS